MGILLWTCRGRMTRISVALVIMVIMVAVVANAAAPTEDLYQLLGVSRKATTKEIKKAYRKKALDTHPDKRKDISAEEAAEAFQKVVHAFEILSDDQSRSRYDRTGSTSDNKSQGGGASGFQQFRWSFNMNRQRRTKLKDKLEAKVAQGRVMHIVSLEQLKTVMLDDDDKLERNLLICFVTPTLESVADDDIVFPYPFAGMSSQGIWWEDLLQTVKIRFNKGNDLTRFFDIPSGTEMKEPIFMYGKRGQELSSSWPRLSTSDRNTFDMWVWKQNEVRVKFVNNHPHPIEVYWVHGTRAKFAAAIEPTETKYHTTMLSHEFYVWDARTDTRRDSPGRNKLSTGACIAQWKILNDKPDQELIINATTCHDLSGHCTFWKAQGECRKNPKFMEEVCMLTCDLCKKTDDERSSTSGNDEL